MKAKIFLPATSILAEFYFLSASKVETVAVTHKIDALSSLRYRIQVSAYYIFAFTAMYSKAHTFHLLLKQWLTVEPNLYFLVSFRFKTASYQIRSFGILCFLVQLGKELNEHIEGGLL